MVLYPLHTVPLLSALSTLASAKTFTDIAHVCYNKPILFRRLGPFAMGLPLHDQGGDIIAAADVVLFRRLGETGDRHAPHSMIAINGKTVRRSGGNRDDQPPRTTASFQNHDGASAWHRASLTHHE
jgi:hypothetical protein